MQGLEDKIEGLIRFGHLKRFIRKNGEGSSRLGYTRETNCTSHKPDSISKDEQRGHPTLKG